MTEVESSDYRDLTVSVFLRSAFLQGVGDDGGDDGLFEWIEERLRSQYPGASISVRAADLLDGDWEIQIGELGTKRLSSTVREDIQERLQTVLDQAVARFPRRQ